MTLKLTFFYNQYKQGFSETYYHPSNNAALTTTNLSTQLLTSMSQFRSLATLMYAVRATQVASPFTSYTRLIRGAYQGAVQTDPDAEPDIVGTTAVLQLVGESGTTRRLFLRGLPDDYVKRDAYGNDLFAGTFKTYVTKMVNQFITAGLMVRKQAKPPDLGLGYAPVINVVANPTNGNYTDISYTTTAGFTPVVGGKVTFRGLTSSKLPGFQRTQTIAAFSLAGVPHITVEYALPGSLEYQPPKLKMWNQSFVYEPISEYSFERFSAHKTGRPFGQLAGQRR